MDLKNFQSLQEAYLDVYNELDEATRMRKKFEGEHGKQRGKEKEAHVRRILAPKDKQKEFINSPLKHVLGSDYHLRAVRKLSKEQVDLYDLELDEELNDNTKKRAIRHIKDTKKLLRSMAREIDNNYYPEPEGYEPESEKKIKTKTQREQVDLYDLILSHLLDEGYAETPEAAEVMMVNMSEEWREDIIEGYKKLPVGKMMWKVSNRAEREADTRAERERQADDPYSTLTYDRARAEHEEAERNKARNYKMIRVADTHNKKAAKAKSKLR